MVEIGASLLAADFLHLADAMTNAEQAGAGFFHVDVMDGHLVEDIAFGVQNVADICRAANIPVDAHLMIAQPQAFAMRMVNAGAGIVTVQLEPCLQTYRTLRDIKEAGARVGVCVAPETPISALTAVAPWVDRVLLVSVCLGLGGQQFIPQMYDKLRQTKELRDSSGYTFEIGVDGGVTLDNVEAIKACGADYMVAGTCVMASEDMPQAISKMTGSCGAGE